MLTWSLGWGNVCQVSPLWNYSFPPSIVYSLEAFTMWRSHIRSGELCSTSLVEEYLHKVFEIFLDGRFISSMLVYVFNKFFLSILTHEYLVFTLNYDPLLFYLFSYSNYSSFGHREPIQLAAVSLWHTPIIVRFGLSFEQVLIFWYYKTIQACLVYFLLQSCVFAQLSWKLYPCKISMQNFISTLFLIEKNGSSQDALQ